MTQVNQPKDSEAHINTFFGFAYWQKDDADTRILRFYWGKILLLILFMTTGAWLAASSALYCFFKYVREYEEVRFTDMLTLPLHLDEHRIKIGSYHIKKGIQLLEDGDRFSAEGFRLLRLGLARNPSHIEARKLCATIFASFQPERALVILTDGLIAYNGFKDTEYIDLTIDLMKYLNKEHELLELTEKLLRDQETDELTQKRLIEEAIGIHILQGNFDQATQSIDKYGIRKTFNGLVFLARINEAKGETENQIYFLKQALDVDKAGKNHAQLSYQICMAYLKLDKIGEALQIAGLLSNHIVFARIHHENGDREAENGQINRMIKTQSHKPDARLQLAAYAAETGNTQLAMAIYEMAAIDSDALQPFILSLIRSKLRANDFNGAQKDIEALLTQQPNWLEVQKPYLKSLQAICSYGLYRPDLGEIYMKEFSTAYANQPNKLLEAAKELLRIEERDKAYELLNFGLQFSQNHPELLALSISLSIDQNSYEKWEDRLRRFLNLRRPDKDFAKRILDATRFNPQLFEDLTERTQQMDRLRSIIQD